MFINIFLENSYASLFLLSFLAATIIPMGSEWLLVALLLQPLDPIPLVAVATVGNTLGGCTTYALGRWGAEPLIKKVLRIDARALSKARGRYERYGSWSLLFSWVPIIGDPLCLVAGVLKSNALLFVVLISIGKLLRYSFLAYITLVAAHSTL